MRLTSCLKYRIRFTLIFCACLGVWQVGGQRLYGNIIYQRQLDFVDQTSHHMVQQLEKTIDFAVSAYSQLLLTDNRICTGALELEMRRLVMDAGAVTDTYIVTPNGICSVFGDVRYMLSDTDERGDWTVGRNPTYRFGILSEQGQTRIGVSRGLGTANEIVLVLNPDAILFGGFPSDLSPHVETNLFVADQSVASLGGAQFTQANPKDISFTTQHSKRYPVSVRIRYDRNALQSAYEKPSASVFIPWLVSGVLMAISVAVLALRRFDPKVEEVRIALKNGNIRPYFQPIVDTSSGRVLACEALARWVEPDGKIISANAFIPTIEKHGFEDVLLLNMLARAKQDLRLILEKDHSFYISFNVTPDQMSRIGFAAELVRNLSKIGFRMNQVCLEITERQQIAEPEIAATNAADLQAAGVRLAIDDAGTGHNGLAALQLLNVGILKIDKFFVDFISTDPQSRIMLDTFVSVAKKFNMKTIAEGVEKPCQVHVLQTAGVSSIQGYIVSTALPGVEFEDRFFAEWLDGAFNLSQQNVVHF